MTWEIISSWRVCIQVFWCIFSFWMLIQWGIVEQSLWVILQFVIKAWNFKNFIIVSQVTIFLTEILCTATWVLKSAFFLWLQIFFLQTMSTYVPFESQFNGDQSFLRNYGLQMYGLRDTGGQNPLYIIIFQRAFFLFSEIYQPKYISQSFLENYSLKMCGFQDSVGHSPWWRHRLPIKCECCCHIETSQLFIQQINWLASIWRQHWRLMD